MSVAVLHRLILFTRRMYGICRRRQRHTNQTMAQRTGERGAHFHFANWKIKRVSKHKLQHTTTNIDVIYSIFLIFLIIMVVFIFIFVFISASVSIVVFYVILLEEKKSCLTL